jgi:hypothetical protein
MGLFEGKTPTERNKIIAAAVLGVISLFALYFAFGRSFFSSSKTTATSKSSPTPTPRSGLSAAATRTEAALPTAGEQDFYYQTTAVYYPGTVSAPDPGRNIFAFYEPPEKCRGEGCPSPTVPPPPPVKSPTPVPPPPILLASLSPQTVYAGSKTFRMELNGDKFTPDSRVYFNQSELPTHFITAQRISVEIPSKLVAGEGSPQIIVQTPDGKLFSNQLFMTVQAAPRPTMLYIGMIGRKRFNNDTAYFTDNEKSPPYGARLNDVLAGRFRLIDMSSVEATLEDTTLGFKYRILISKGIAIGSMPPGRGNDSGSPGIPTYNPGFVPPSDIPGIPNNIQRFNPNMSEEEKKKLMEVQKQDVDDEGDN